MERAFISEETIRKHPVRAAVCDATADLMLTVPIALLSVEPIAKKARIRYNKLRKKEKA